MGASEPLVKSRQDRFLRRSPVSSSKNRWGGGSGNGYGGSGRGGGSGSGKAAPGGGGEAIIRVMMTRPVYTLTHLRQKTRSMKN